jgi:hypothetical protein
MYKKSTSDGFCDKKVNALATINKTMINKTTLNKIRLNKTTLNKTPCDKTPCAIKNPRQSSGV